MTPVSISIQEESGRDEEDNADRFIRLVNMYEEAVEYNDIELAYDIVQYIKSNVGD